MIETKWTPGPWFVTQGFSDWGMPSAHAIGSRRGVQFGEADLIAEVPSVTPYCLGAPKGDIEKAARAWADATLISAAPDLYEALKAYEQWEASLILEGDWSDGPPKMTPEQFDDLFELQVIRNSALDKAKGKL